MYSSKYFDNNERSQSKLSFVFKIPQKINKEAYKLLQIIHNFVIDIMLATYVFTDENKFIKHHINKRNVNGCK